METTEAKEILKQAFDKVCEAIGYDRAEALMSAVMAQTWKQALETAKSRKLNKLKQ